MQIEHVKLNFERKSEALGFEYALFKPASADDLLETETRFGVNIPEIVKLFYKNYNGLEVYNPKLLLFPLKEWAPKSNDLIHFATVNEEHHLCFDTLKLNKANQWSILNCKTNYLVTYSMSSFWSNKIWNWVVKQRTIWKEEKYHC